jgi:hypothetical protein
MKGRLPAVLALLRCGRPGWRLLVLLLTIFVPTTTAAAEDKPGTLFEDIHEGHEEISERIVATALWLDSFFADERYEAEAQTTRWNLRFSLFAERGEPTDYDVDQRLRLSLPAFNDRLQLLFSADEEEADEEERVEGARRQDREEEERGIVASVRYFFRRTVSKNISLRTGVRLRGGSPVFFLEPRYRQNMPGPWMLRFTQRAMGYSDGDLSARTILDLERPLPASEKFFFRATAEGLWRKETPGYAYSLSFALFQTIDEKQVLEYVWGNQFQTSPSHRLEDTRLILVYRRTVGFPWLFLEIAPQVGFPHDQNRRLTPAIRVQLEAVFGAWDRKKRRH